MPLVDICYVLRFSAIQFTETMGFCFRGVSLSFFFLEYLNLCCFCSHGLSCSEFVLSFCRSRGFRQQCPPKWWSCFRNPPNRGPTRGGGSRIQRQGPADGAEARGRAGGSELGKCCDGRCAASCPKSRVFGCSIR